MHYHVGLTIPRDGCTRKWFSPWSIRPSTHLSIHPAHERREHRHRAAVRERVLLAKQICTRILIHLSLCQFFLCCVALLKTFTTAFTDPQSFHIRGARLQNYKTCSKRTEMEERYLGTISN